MVIAELSIFKKLVDRLLSDDQRFELFNGLAARPEAGDLIPGGGGARKMRFGQVGRGKRGGLRVIYAWSPAKDQILCVYVYPKSEKSDLIRIPANSLRICSS
jgi:mRNA-degrading endonuclease RelE of RelBE toxin-antitoxin system